MTSTDPVPVETSKAIHRQTGKNFYVATRLFPKRIRRATYALYGFFRVADDVVDDPEGSSPREQRDELARIRSAVLTDGRSNVDDPDDAVLTAFRSVADDAGIDDREIRSFLDSMAMDIDTSQYRTYDDLERYLRGSAVAVAYMMLDVMGAQDREQARPHARALGEAFQLTNFVRDVREDIRDFGRLYLPLETLGRYGAGREEIEAYEFTPGVAAAVEHELQRAEHRYRDGVEGIQYLPTDCQFPVLLAAVLYAEHHRLIRRRNFDVLTQRTTLSRRHRIAATIRTWWHWRRSNDPVEIFNAVSAIPVEPGAAGTTDVGRPTASDTHTERTVDRSRARSVLGWVDKYLP